MKKIKVLHLYKNFYPKSYGGVETFISDLISGLETRSISHTILCHNNLKNFINVKPKKNLKIYSIKKIIQIFSTPISFAYIKYFYYLVSKSDIIHFHYPYPFLDFLCLFTSNKKIIITYHSDIVKQKIAYFFYKLILLKNIFNKSQVVVATSKNYAVSSPILIDYKKKIKIIPFGMNKPKDTKIPSASANFFLFIGNNRYYKNLNLLLSVAQDNNFHLVVLTNFTPSNLKIKQKYKNNKNIKFFFNVSNKKKNNFIKSCRCIVLPSHQRSEAFGLVLLEGLRYGKPLISCDINTGTSFVNKHNVTGLVIKPDNYIELRNSIQKMLINKNYKNFSKNSIKRFNKLFDKKIMCNKYYKLYKQVNNANTSNFS